MSEPRALVAASSVERVLPLRAVLVGSLVACFAGVALTFVSRRVGGALLEPLPTSAVVSMAIVVAATAALVRRLATDNTGDTHVQRWLAVAISLLAFIVAASVSLPGTSPIGLATLWTIIVGSEAWAWQSTIAANPRGGRERLTPISLYSPVLDDSVDIVELHDEVSDEQSSDENEDVEEASELPSANITQQLTRERLVDGGELLSGSLRVSFAPRERTTVAHVAFCPPFETVPEVSVESWDGPGASVKVVQTLLHGMRIEVKLDRESSLESNVLIAFEALSSPAT